MTELPPGPRTPPWFNLLGLWTRPAAYLERLRARYGTRITLRLPFGAPFVLLSDPDEIRALFTAPPDVLHPGEGARVLKPILGAHSVILLDEDDHLEQRKLLLPAFHGEKMRATDRADGRADRARSARRGRSTSQSRSIPACKR